MAEANAKHVKHKKSHATTHAVTRAAPAKSTTRSYTPPYADIVIDASTGQVLSQTDADRALYPASLTKLMTLLMTFEALDAKTITVPIANHDNNQHAENENIRIGNLFEGIEIMAALMMIR